VTPRRRTAALALLVAALALAVLGQVYFFRRPEYVWDGVVLHALAIACFLLAWRLVEPARRRAAAAHLRMRPRRWPVPALLLAAGLVFSLLATLVVRNRTSQQPTGDAAALWLIGVAFAVAAALWPASPPAEPGLPRRRLPALRLPTLSSQAWLEIGAVTALTLLALALRVVALSSVPFTLGGDEAWHGLLARQVLSGELRNPFVMGYMSMPTFFYWPLSWSLWLVNNGLLGLRLPAALVGAACVPLFYGLVRSLWGRRTALLSTIFLVTYDYHIHYSRLGANNVWDVLFAIVAIWGLDRGLAARRAGGNGGTRSLAMAGLALGLAFFFYTGARLLPVLMLAYAALIWLERRKAPGAEQLSAGDVARALALVGVVAVIVAGPMLGFALAHPDDWNARINQIGILQSGWLAREPGLTGKTTARILAEQFLHSAGAFHVFADRTVWYAADRPLLDLVPGVFMLLGMAWAAVHWRERRSGLLLLWFWSVILSGGMLTEGPPSSQRLVMAIPAVCLLVAVGLEQAVLLGRRLLVGPAGSGPASRRWAPETLLLVLVIAALGASNVRYYFVELMPQRQYGSENGETATMMAYYLQGRPAGTAVYLAGAPRMYWGFGTMGFLAPQVEGHDVTEPLTAPPQWPPAAAGRQTLVIFLPERAAELPWVEQAMPGGQVREVKDAEGRLRFIVYEAPS
jgi:4-amino-4-deoxy-L-arabinose transferase-like glycosyltransferase